MVIYCSAEMEITRIFYFLQKWPTDKSYFLAKEILMTERTYKKDLDVLNSVS